jgi:S-adenosylmethionine:tRNA ribosyltransferase-isomerase
LRFTPEGKRHASASSALKEKRKTEKLNVKDINLDDYDYDLPEDRIAQYPVKERDLSQFLVYKENRISGDIFRNIADYLPADTLLVFNNTKVIRARILFRKPTGAAIEVLCLEPLLPFEYELSFGSKDPVEWKCIIGNLKKWKTGKITSTFTHNSQTFYLDAERICPEGEAWRVRFSWNNNMVSFSEVIEAKGHIPLPPYINREDEALDTDRYQTVYSSVKGSVAAPTAGLHFTDHVFKELKTAGIRSVEVTLHVGAGTFKPVKTKNIADHEMHCEHFYISGKTIDTLLESRNNIIAVGTTSVRTLESLYWLGVKLIQNPAGDINILSLGQWDTYNMESDITVKESLQALRSFIRECNCTQIEALTSIMIIPGYKFRIIKGMITNFHQPRSTLLLLISAWIGEPWKKVYEYAMDNGFRFLSYGDSSLLMR